jgi:rhamnulose-1-phosphate aldolase
MEVCSEEAMTEPSPSLETLLDALGDCGWRLADLGACEGAAGNLSVCLRGALEVRGAFPLEERVTLPLAVPGLAGATLVVSGSGRRLREIQARPGANLACLVVDPGGTTAAMFTAPERGFRQVTSEFNSHLAVHRDRMAAGAGFHAVVHAQPPHLTFLSHIPRYQDPRFLNARLLRWQPETILNLPEGIGFAPFQVPGSAELSLQNATLCRTHQVVLWARHGVMSRSEDSVQRATDLIEYAEAAARYEYLNLAAGEPSEGLGAEEIRAVCAACGVEQGWF